MNPPVDHGPYLEILQSDRCPLCFLLHDYIHEHLKSVMEESVTDPSTRQALFDSRGFCRRHAWQAVQQGKSLGMAIIYGSLLDKGLKDLSPQPSRWKKNRRKPCPLCRSEEKREESQVRQFALAWCQSEKLRKDFSAKGVLCLNHLEKTLAQKMDPAGRKMLYETGKKALERLMKDLNEFLEKQDYHRSHESLGRERDAWIRAVRMVAGERD